MQTAAALESILSNPFVNHFVDCIENLPNSLQCVLSELRNVDVKVKEYHNKLTDSFAQLMNEQDGQVSNEANDQLGNLHNTLIKCQELGDQKVVLVSQIIDLINAKSKQLILDTKSLDNPIFKTELNEERIINEFKSTIKQRYLLMHNTNMSNNSNNNTCTSTSSTTANSIYYATSAAMNHTNKSFNLVTKAMSKYNYMSNYEQQQQQHQHQSTSYANSKQNTGDYRLANNTSSNSCSKTLRHQTSQQHSKYTSSSASKIMSNNNNNNSSTYQLPDRRAKKPKIDSDINNKTQNSNQSMITRPKRQLQYTPTTEHPQRTNTVAATTMATSKSSINSMKKRRLMPHQSSPSSHSTSSSSSISLKQRQSMRQLTPATAKSHDDLDEEYTGDEPMARQKHVNNDLSDISSDETLSPTHVDNNNSMKTEAHVANQTSEPNEPLYCTCQQVSYGQMILCDNHTCTLEWFHFDCVDLQSKPKGKWYCPNCRGDTHKVMKKMNNQNQSTSRSK